MKKTVILIIAAMMALPVSYAYATEAQTSKEMIQKKPKKQKAEVKEVTFLVHLHCENCVNKVVENVSFEKGVKDLKVSLENQTVFVKFDANKTSETTLKTAIEKLGYPVAGVVAPGHENCGHNHGHDHGHGHNHAH